MIQVPLIYGYYLVPSVPITFELHPGNIAEEPEPEIEDGEASLNET
jgi:hypothetical protein